MLILHKETQNPKYLSFVMSYIGRVTGGEIMNFDSMKFADNIEHRSESTAGAILFKLSERDIFSLKMKMWWLLLVSPIFICLLGLEVVNRSVILFRTDKNGWELKNDELKAIVTYVFHDELVWKVGYWFISIYTWRCQCGVVKGDPKRLDWHLYDVIWENGT